VPPIAQKAFTNRDRFWFECIRRAKPVRIVSRLDHLFPLLFQWDYNSRNPERKPKPRQRPANAALCAAHATFVRYCPTLGIVWNSFGLCPKRRRARVFTLAPFFCGLIDDQSILLVARSITAFGNSTPIFLAAPRLMTRSVPFAISTEMSPGFSPFRMRATTAPVCLPTS